MFGSSALTRLMLLLLLCCLRPGSVGTAAASIREAADPLASPGRASNLSLQQSERRFLPIAGKTIRRIRVMRLDVFGTSISDTSLAAGSRFVRGLNNLNFRTLARTVRRNLLFREGDPVDPFRLAESERILRNLTYIRDARVMADRGEGSADSVDVVVVVKESWTLKLSVSPKEGNGGKGSLTEHNLLGLGHQISAALTVAPGLSPRFDAKYTAQNIRGSFVTGRLDYSRMPEERSTALIFSRELVSAVLRYAGSLELQRISIEVPDSLPSQSDSRHDRIDLWAGRSISVGSQSGAYAGGRIVLASGRVLHSRFSKRPPVTRSSALQYHNADYYLAGLALIQSRYYEQRLLYDFGRVEDVPYGYAARVAYGLADGEFSRSGYLSAGLAAGERITSLGYGVGELRVGGKTGSGKLTLGAFRFRSLCFSNLLQVGPHQIRQFIGAEFVTGVHRAEEDLIDLAGKEGVRGVTYDREVRGSKRLKLSAETVLFTPWRPRAFTFACFTFADLDFIGVGSRSLFAQYHASALGLGIRVDKESLGLGPVQLRFAWYPNLPVDHAEYAYTATGETRYRAIEFLGDRPDIVEY